MAITNSLEYVWLGELVAQSVLVLIASIVFLWHVQKSRDVPSLSNYYKGLSWFFFFAAISGFVDFLQQISTYYLGQTGFFGNSFQWFPATSPTIFNTFTFYFIISILQLSYAILLYEVENFIRQSKSHYLTIILVICFVVSLVAYIGWIFPRNLQGLVSNIIIWTMIPFALIIFYLGVFYLVLAKRSVGAVRHKALLVAFGIGFIFASIIFDLLYRQYCLSANIQIWWVLPVIFRAVGIIGVPMLIYGFRRESTLT